MTIYLYVKQHTITGLKYFGKTTKKDPLKYHGSGTYWKRHIKKHGLEHVITLNIWKYENIDECSKFALDFSHENNIVESSSWANLKPENGRDGGRPKGCKQGPNNVPPPPMLGTIAAAKVNKTRIYKPKTDEQKRRQSILMTGKPSKSKGQKRGPMPLESVNKMKNTLRMKYKTEIHHRRGSPPWNKGQKGSTQGSPGKRTRCSCIQCGLELGSNNLNQHFRSHLK